MKKVFSSANDVIHMFAQRTQSEGRCFNVYFEHDKCYSYGRHYVLGKFITNHNNELAIMINDKGYSSTTAKHIAIMRGATRQYKQLFTTRTQWGEVASQLRMLTDKVIKATKPEKYINEALDLFQSYTEYCKWIDVAPHVDVVSLMDTFLNYDPLKLKAIRLREAEQKRAKLAKQVADFMSYETERMYGADEDFVRVSLDGTRIETSQGIRVTLDEAKALYAIIKSGRDIKGMTIGGYTVIGLNGHLKVGCHHINRANMVEIGEKLLNL